MELSPEALDQLVAEIDFANGDGLVPTVTCDWRTNEVLMVAYMNEQSFRHTLTTGLGTYWSRSRQELWVKGKTSGHVQHVKWVRLDLREQALSEEEAYKLTHPLAQSSWRRTEEFPTGAVIDYYRMLTSSVGYFALCGAVGCIRTCMDHLERAGRIGQTFHQPFRRRRMWRLPHDAHPQ